MKTVTLPLLTALLIPLVGLAGEGGSTVGSGGDPLIAELISGLYSYQEIVSLPETRAVMPEGSLNGLFDTVPQLIHRIVTLTNRDASLEYLGYRCTDFFAQARGERSSGPESVRILPPLLSNRIAHCVRRGGEERYLYKSVPVDSDSSIRIDIPVLALAFHVAGNRMPEGLAIQLWMLKQAKQFYDDIARPFFGTWAGSGIYSEVTVRFEGSEAPAQVSIRAPIRSSSRLYRAPDFEHRHDFIFGIFGYLSRERSVLTLGEEGTLRYHGRVLLRDASRTTDGTPTLLGIFQQVLGASARRMMDTQAPFPVRAPLLEGQPFHQLALLIHARALRESFHFEPFGFNREQFGRALIETSVHLSSQRRVVCGPLRTAMACNNNANKRIDLGQDGEVFVSLHLHEGDMARLQSAARFVMHEYLGILGIDDSAYRTSSAIAEALFPSNRYRQ